MRCPATTTGSGRGFEMDFANRIDAMNENIVSDAREGTANAFCLLACVFSCSDGNEAFYGCFWRRSEV